MFTVLDVLTKSLIGQALEWDIKDNLPRAPKDRSNRHLMDFVNLVNECGVSLNVWEKKNADGLRQKATIETPPRKVKGLHCANTQGCCN